MLRSPTATRVSGSGIPGKRRSGNRIMGGYGRENSVESHAAIADRMNDRSAIAHMGATLQLPPRFWQWWRLTIFICVLALRPTHAAGAWVGASASTTFRGCARETRWVDSIDSKDDHTHAPMRPAAVFQVHNKNPDLRCGAGAQILGGCVCGRGAVCVPCRRYVCFLKRGQNATGCRRH